jgi:hypothetical protein
MSLTYRTSVGKNLHFFLGYIYGIDVRFLIVDSEASRIGKRIHVGFQEKTIVWDRLSKPILCHLHTK